MLHKTKLSPSQKALRLLRRRNPRFFAPLPSLQFFPGGHQWPMVTAIHGVWSLRAVRYGTATGLKVVIGV